MPGQRVLVAAGTSLLVALAACSDTSQPTSPEPPDQPQLRPAAQQPAGPLTLARGVRGFGGFFLDAHATPTIYLTDEAERGNAEQALEPWLREHGRAPSELRVLRGQFDWTQLERWLAEATPAALAVAGAVFVDADEAANRIRVGVVDAAAGAGVRSALARTGIPASAVLVTETEPIRLMVTLRDRVRPIVGGLQINFPGFLCTLGFNAVAGGQNSFITNSHCTETQGGVDDTPYWQPRESVDPQQIATEVADPEYPRGGPGCPPGRRCRFSDASRAAYAPGIEFDLGTIARTAGPNLPAQPDNSHLTITGNFRIQRESHETEFVVGSTLNKMGRTTGWTQGTVRLTCVNVGVLGSNIVQFCQTLVTAGVAGGDSGSPVFEQGGGSNVTLAGILWGGGGGDLVFSPLANIEQELGPLQTR